MKVLSTTLDGVLLIQPRVFSDSRGYFMETWHHGKYRENGIDINFRQTNLSRSTAGVLRGLHYQWPQPQAKLVQVLQGAVFDVAVDIRPNSPNYLNWVGVELSAQNHHQLFIPEGFAHGFITLSDTAMLAYACSREYSPEADASIAWDDPEIAIDWPVSPVSLSDKDSEASKISNVPRTKLPEFFE
jgi:dTDP-4-dehydrorhamnose 3,5-epimerase